MELKFKNILGFEDIHFNFSYKRKVKKNIIENEFIPDIPTFNYKKVNVIAGSNSTGKSCLGKAIWGICLFFRNKEGKHVTDLVSEGSKDSSISIDYVTRGQNNYILNRVLIKISLNPDGNSYSILMNRDFVTLRKGDTYESASSSFSNNGQLVNYMQCLTDLKHQDGWLVAMPITENGFDKFESKLDEKEREGFSIVLLKVLSTLDPNIISAIPSKEIDDAYIITYDDGKNTIVKDGDKLADIRYLSSGTKYGFVIAQVLYGIKNHKNRFYYIDELFSYVNSDVEIAALAEMISLLGDNEQLFFTSHNNEIMNLKLPFHSYTFLGKEKKENKTIIKVVNAADVENRNNVAMKNLVENDAFGVAPDVNKIYSIEGDNNV